MMYIDFCLNQKAKNSLNNRFRRVLFYRIRRLINFYFLVVALKLEHQTNKKLLLTNIHFSFFLGD